MAIGISNALENMFGSTSNCRDSYAVNTNGSSSVDYQRVLQQAVADMQKERIPSDTPEYHLKPDDHEVVIRTAILALADIPHPERFIITQMTSHANTVPRSYFIYEDDDGQSHIIYRQTAISGSEINYANLADAAARLGLLAKK